jgi:PAS domain S-box-containing protein
MSNPVRILYLDNSLLDRQRVRDVLEKTNDDFILTEVSSRADFEARFSENEYDLVLSDFNTLEFDGLQVLDRVHAQKPYLPVIIVSNTDSENITIEVFKHGAADYVFKAHPHIQRLPKTICTALVKAQLEQENQSTQKALRESEAKYRQLVENINDVIFVLDLHGFITYVSPVIQSISEFQPEEMTGQHFKDFIHPDDLRIVLSRFNEALFNKSRPTEYRLITKSKHSVWVRSFSQPIFENGCAVGMRGVMIDITERKQAEEALYENYATLHGILECSDALIFSVDRQYRYTSFNKAHAAVMKVIYGQNIQMGVSILDYMVVESDRIKAKANIDRALSGENILEEAFSGDEGFSRFYFEVSHTPIMTETGVIIGVAIFSKDISKRKQTLEALRESEERFRGAFEQSPTGMCMITPDGVFLRANSALCLMLGYLEKELIGSSLYKITHPEDITVVDLSLNQPVENKHESFQFEKRYIHKHGHIIWASITSSMVCNSSDEPLYFICQIQNITDRKKTEAALEEERNLLETFLTNIPDSIYFKDLQGRFTRINQAQTSCLGLTDPSQALGKTDFDFFSEEHAQPAYEDEQKIIRSGQPLIGIEEEENWPEGRTRWISTTKMPLRDKQGQIIGTFGISRDITERKRMEFSLQQRLTELQLVNKLSVSLRAGDNVRELLFILLDETLKTTHTGDGGIFLYESTHNALILSVTRGWLDILHNLSLNPDEDISGYVFRNGKTYTSPEIHADNLVLEKIRDLIPPEWGGVFLPIQCNAGTIGVLVVSVQSPRIITGNEMRMLTIISQLAGNAIYRSRLHDQLKLSNETLQNEIDQRAAVQNLLATEKELLSTTLMSIGEGVIVTNEEGIITLFNHSAESITGYTSTEAIEKPLNTIFQLCDSNSLEIFQDVIRSMFELDYAQKVELKYRAPTLITRVGLRLLVAGSISALKSNKGEIFGFVIVFQDVTEKQKLESQTVLSQKMEAIGQLAAGIAHEINTPIQYIGDNLNFLGKAFSRYVELLNIYHQVITEHVDKPFTQDDLAFIEDFIRHKKIAHYTGEIPNAINEGLEGIERVRKIVLAMREFSHPSEKEKKMADINHGIETTIAISRNEWKYCAEMQANLDPDLPLVLCQIDEINQVILNMIINASQAIQEMEPENSEHKELISISTRKDDNKVLIIIRDTGPGIPEGIRERIFDPFFTTKGVGKGTGQGLSLAHNIIVNNHHGKISVESGVGCGTIFTIELPIDLSDTEL